MRYSRSQEFETALAWSATPAATKHGRWADHADDPNAASALASRGEVLRNAWRDPIKNRTVFLLDRCRGKRVLDIGCVAHDIARMSSPDWLHGRIAGVAQRCVGVDVLDEGVAEMNRLGYVAVSHDLTSGLGPLAVESPFDVIVAGELIEHVESMDMLFRTAAVALAPVGELIITTPNPWAPSRVRAGQRGNVWENVDHILFAFPSGIAELAQRHDLLLAEAFTASGSRGRTPVAVLRDIRAWARGRGWPVMGFASLGPRRIVRIQGRRLARWIRGVARPSRRFVGETFVYVVRRPEPDGVRA
ncbi:unannotated protein [freshwater metagenome]|uniref:Unannotated protein n=1 Tax=freshwater metagenome TaxID=449393 RepID=A0A6J7D5I2_9ZZZZ